MKKHFLFVLVLISGFLMNGQTNAYQKIKNIITTTHPEISLDDRLIAFTTWSINNEESREANKGFEKAYRTYEHAILKGGRKGIVVISVNKDNLSEQAQLALTSDGVTKLISIKLSDLSGLDTQLTNAVYDANGNEVYKNLAPSAIYSSINHLITR